MVLEDKGDEVDDKGPIKIEVRNVPDTTPLESLKAFFESKDSDSDVGAVADISSIETGVFHVTFHDQSGKEIGYIDISISAYFLTVAERVMSKPRRVKRGVLQMRKLEEVAHESEESDSDDEPTQIEVRNVPEKITEFYIKTFFERPRSGGKVKLQRCWRWCFHSVIS